MCQYVACRFLFEKLRMATKEKDVLGHIIDLYKDMPYLWNKNDKNYMNKTIRCEGFEVLLSIYKNVDKNATIKTLKKKIDNLKTNYLKELKKVSFIVAFIYY
ncbi:hypothetical protein B5X24_HaOG214949 [Helicoverpa armigera]|uniref:MADF domain-containing protein n=1 Tax=Helicoverpa armigera TaxID=29058 RepID=A0A2W1B851_HELAM|nr:hypothetical protein B5X24_HaOG214949 [Helicoverpa armigera]